MTRTLQACLAFAAVALVGVVSGCGSSDTDQSQDAQDTAGQMPRFPGAFGEIAGVSGTTLQVRNDQSGEVKVTYTDATEFTQQLNGSMADLAVGNCVVVMSDGASDSGPVAATAVTVSAAVDESCQGGMNPGGMPSGTPPSGQTPPSGGGMPSGAPPSGQTPPSGGGMPGGGVAGLVTTVTDTGFTVESTAPGGESGEPRSVTVSANTTWTTTEAATASALTVGRCVNATGETDDSGAVTATRIAVSDPVDGECAGGFGPGSGS